MATLFNLDLAEYRKHLLLAEQKSQEDLDKTVISLSGGALGLSFAFIDKFIKSGPPIHPRLLFLAWTSWTASVALILASYFVSVRALRKAIIQTDAGEIYEQDVGGFAARLVDWLTVGGMILFALGVVLIGFFVKFNLGAQR